MTEQIVADLVTANRILADQDLIKGYGHLSAREPGADEMFISRSRSPEFVTDDDIMRVSLDGEILEGSGEPYGETVLHRAIYRERDDVNGVVHYHAEDLMPFTVADVTLRAVNRRGVLFADPPLFEAYDPEKGTLIVGEAEAERMADNLGDARAQLLRNHGANVVGPDIRVTTLMAIDLAKNARLQQRAEQLGGGRYYTPSEAELDTFLEDMLAPDSGGNDRRWEYLVSKLEA